MSLSRQLSVFLFILSLCAALHYVIFIVLVQLSLLDPVWASALGFCISTAVNYCLNRRHSFLQFSPLQGLDSCSSDER